MLKCKIRSALGRIAPTGEQRERMRSRILSQLPVEKEETMMLRNSKNRKFNWANAAAVAVFAVLLVVLSGAILVKRAGDPVQSLAPVAQTEEIAGADDNGQMLRNFYGGIQSPYMASYTWLGYRNSEGMAEMEP